MDKEYRTEATKGKAKEDKVKRLVVTPEMRRERSARARAFLAAYGMDIEGRS